VDEREALEGLARTEAKLRSFADEYGLVVRSELPWPGAQPPAQQPGPIKHAIWSVSGRLPGGAVGRLRHQAVFGSTFGINVDGQHTIMVCRLPETVGYVPMVCCRPDELMSNTYYWGGDRRPKVERKFESLELDRRFVIEVAKGQGENWLFQLFSPSFIDFLAHETPRDFGFKLDSGVFTCETPQWRGQPSGEEALLDNLALLATVGGRVAGRLRDEVLEEENLGDAPDSAAAHGDWAGGRKHGRLVGMLLKFAGGGEDDGIAAYAKQRDLAVVDPAQFHSRHLRLPLPGTATSVVEGVMAGSPSPAALAWIEYSSEVDMQHNYLALVREFERELPPMWVDADDVGAAGVGEELPPAARQLASEFGYGVSSAGRAACAYWHVPGFNSWPKSEQIDEFAGRAVRVLGALG
jgi:hypothetical protein